MCVCADTHASKSIACEINIFKYETVELILPQLHGYSWLDIFKEVILGHYIHIPEAIPNTALSAC